MPLFVAVHRWKPEEEKAVMKEMLALDEWKFPKGVELCASWLAEIGDQRAFCVWKARTKEDLENFFEEYAPIVKKGTEFVPVLQVYPATISSFFRLSPRWLRSRF